MIDANFIRVCKLALVSGGAGFCAASAAFLLQGDLRRITAGVTAGLTLATVAALAGAYRRRGPLDASPAAQEKKKARHGRTLTVIAILLGNIALVAVRLLHAEWLAAGFGLGIFAFFGLMLSPLFWAKPSSRVETSPRARMTSVERAVTLPYE
jgi:hypothetical protein